MSSDKLKTTRTGTEMRETEPEPKGENPNQKKKIRTGIETVILTLFHFEIYSGKLAAELNQFLSDLMINSSDAPSPRIELASQK